MGIIDNIFLLHPSTLKAAIGLVTSQT